MGQENEKTAKTAKRQGKAIKVMRKRKKIMYISIKVRSISDTFLFASHLMDWNLGTIEIRPVSPEIKKKKKGKPKMHTHPTFICYRTKINQNIKPKKQLWYQ